MIGLAFFVRVLTLLDSCLKGLSKLALKKGSGKVSNEIEKRSWEEGERKSSSLVLKAGRMRLEWD